MAVISFERPGSRPGARAGSPRPGPRAGSPRRSRQLPWEDLRQLAADAERVLRPQLRAELGPAPRAQAWAEHRVSAPFLGPRADVGTVADYARPTSFAAAQRRASSPGRAGGSIHERLFRQAMSTYNARVQQRVAALAAMRAAANQHERELEAERATEALARAAGQRQWDAQAAARVQAVWRGLLLRRMLVNVHAAARVLQRRVRRRWPHETTQQRRQLRTLREKQRGAESIRARAAWDGSPIRVTGGRANSRPASPQRQQQLPGAQPALIAHPASPALGADAPRSRQPAHSRLHALAKERRLRLEEKQAQCEAELRAHELDGCTFKPNRVFITGYDSASLRRRDEPDSDGEVAWHELASASIFDADASAAPTEEELPPGSPRPFSTEVSKRLNAAGVTKF
ncbi:hypothetical protein T492DRAFT_890537 [Pavlovales sp. CCMP2436]|nr:hypothetical protein T492DRAFT_890537 [Pavlovales sp. CCMP2436]